MFFAYSRDWLTISSGVSVGRCFTETSAGVPGAAADGGAIGAGAGPCANTVLATNVVVSSTSALATAPFISPLVALPFSCRRTSEEHQGNQIVINSAGIICMAVARVNTLRLSCARWSLPVFAFKPLQSDLDQRFWEPCQGSDYCDAWNTNGNETSTDPPDGAGKRQRAISDLMQLATSASPSVSSPTSTPDTVPACVIVQ